MRVEVAKSFEKDMAKIRDPNLAKKVLALIELMENSNSLVLVPDGKKMKAPGNYYRIRVGQYRLGLKHNMDHLELIRFLHRKDIYKYFP